MSELLQDLIESGTPAKLVAQVAMALAELATVKAQLETKRGQNAERQARFKERHRVTLPNVSERYSDEQKKGPPDPLKENNTPLRSPRGEKATRLPDDFVVPEDWIVWAMERRHWPRSEAMAEGECFSRYWQAKGGRDAAKRSWKKTWENWVDNSRRASGKPAGPANDLVAQAARYAKFRSGSG